jgi:hypothetical protein
LIRECVKGFYTLVFLFFSGDIVCQQSKSDVTAHKIVSEHPVNGIRIAWDYTTLKQLSPVHANYSGYVRMIKLQNGNLFCVFESDGAVHAIQSNDGGKQWSPSVILASRANNIARAVPEVLQLQDQSILVSYNLRPRSDNANPEKRFSIEIIKSTDGGEHWSEPIEIYKAGFDFKNGCWEPAQIQLPSGEIQLFIANEGPYTQTDEQEITMFRSVDTGVTWSKGETVSFRSGHRDGMPVPLLLKNKEEIIVAIEDNGVDGKEFKPVIIRTPSAQSWKKGPVGSFDDSREYALDESNRIAKTKYAGAPYIRQLGSGEVVLSYQGNEYRKDFQWDRSDMIVSIGSSDGRHFNRKSTPFYFSDPSKTALWNSLCIENDSTVIALSSTNAYGKTSVWMVKGYVMPEIKSRRGTLTLDAEKSERLWKTKPSVFIGGFGKTQAHIHTSWDSSMLYFAAEVRDEKVFDTSSDPLKDDAIQFFLDPENLSTNVPVESIFFMTITAAGMGFYKQGKNGAWSDWKAVGVEIESKRTATGYQMEVGIPWTAIHRRPEMNMRIGFHAAILENSGGDQQAYTEPIAGNTTDAPYTWSPLFLTE